MIFYTLNKLGFLDEVVLPPYIVLAKAFWREGADLKISTGDFCKCAQAMELSCFEQLPRTAFLNLA